MTNVIVLALTFLLLGAMVICRPAWLSSNSFLIDFVDHEAISLLAVILTITLASVANIHLSMNRILLAARSRPSADLVRSAQAVKSETRDDAWYIFWGFVIAILAVIFKGAVINTTAIAVSHALVLFVYVLFLVCLRDIHRIIFGLAELELEMGNSTQSVPPTPHHEQRSGAASAQALKATRPRPARPVRRPQLPRR